MLGFSGGSYYQWQRMAPYVENEYSLMQGSVMCSYIPTLSEDIIYINQEDVKQETKHEDWEELEDLKESSVVLTIL